MTYILNTSTQLHLIILNSCNSLQKWLQFDNFFMGYQMKYYISFYVISFHLKVIKIIPFYKNNMPMMLLVPKSQLNKGDIMVEGTLKLKVDILQVAMVSFETLNLLVPLILYNSRFDNQTFNYT